VQLFLQALAVAWLRSQPCVKKTAGHSRCTLHVHIFSERLIQCSTSLFAWLAYFSFFSVVASLLRTFYAGHPSECFPALLLSRYQRCLWCVLSRLLRAQLLVHFPQPSDRALSLRLVPLRLLQITITRATVLLHQLRCFVLLLGHPRQRYLLLLIVLAPEALHVRGMQVCQAPLPSALCQCPMQSCIQTRSPIDIILVDFIKQLCSVQPSGGTVQADHW